MKQAYYTYQICITDDCKSVQVHKLSPTNKNLGEPKGEFLFLNNKEKIEQKLKLVIDEQIDLESTRCLGEILFNSLFDRTLAQDFLNFRHEVIEKSQFLRVELDIDEEKNPHIVALPWEFLCIPQSLNQGAAWLATDSNLVFSRRRKLPKIVKPIQLQADEKLRIGLAIASPTNKGLGNVEYEDIEKELDNLAKKLPKQVKLLPIVKNASTLTIKHLLEQKPHIFHFIGHGQLDNNNGKIALVEDTIGKASWVDAQSFSQLFNVHYPAVILLQACEGGRSSNLEGFVSVSAKIINQSIPVVVAMQYKVSNIAATIFVQKFYQELGEGKPVDIAVQRGRDQIYSSDTESPGRDFATPILFMNVRDGYIFHRDEVKKNFIDIAVDNKPPTLLDENNQLNWDQIPFDIIQTAYRESLPPSLECWELYRVEEIIKYLKKCQRYDQFLIKLSKNKNLSEAICNQLRELAIVEKNQENKKVTQEFLKPYLIVSIKPINNTKSFLLNAWLVEDDSLPRNSLSNIDFKPLINEGTTQPGLVCDFEKIPEIFKQILEEALDYLLKIEKEYSLTIEFFLPKDLMCTAVEQWKIDNTINEISVGTMYAIHLRSVERQDMNYLRKHRSPWLAKWNQLRAILDTKEQSVESFHPHQEATFDYKSLKMILDTKIGLKATCVVSTDTIVKLLDAILLARTPIAVWTRHSLPNLDSEINKILFAKPLNNLCESIRKAREKADGEEKHLGNHLALLWENPYRLTPDVMCKLRPTGQ